MIALLLRVSVTLAMAATADAANAESLIVSLSAHQVRVSSSFVGADLVLFGQIVNGGKQEHGRYDVVVTVKGPPRTLALGQKEKMLGIWTTAKPRIFRNAPSYMAVLTNQPPMKFSDAGSLTDFALKSAFDGGSDVQSAASPDRHALISTMQDRGLYILQSDAVTFLTSTLFRASIHLPPETPVGAYDVDATIFVRGTDVGRTSSAFEVFKVGVEQFLATSAQAHSLLYGLCVALMATATGWGAALAFRRD